MTNLLTPKVKYWGRVAYQPVWHAMQKFTDQREELTADEWWIVEHEPVFTLGQAGKWEHVLNPGDIPVVPVDRGGQVTYHGPGQLVVYPLLDLRRLGIGVRELVSRLEQSAINTLQTWNISGDRKEGAPGVYVNHEKIMAIGLRVRRGCSFHGIAFNIHMDLTPFARINPCGYQGLKVTQVTEHGGPNDLKHVTTTLLSELSSLFYPSHIDLNHLA